MELNTRIMDKQARTRRAKRLKRKLKHTLEGAFKHFEENRHLEIKTLVKTDVKCTLRRFYKQEARRTRFDQFGRIYDTAAGMADIQLGAKPDDWVLGEDGKIRWVHDVTSSTDPDLNGRKWLGAGKYDGWNYANENRSWLEKQMGWGPDNVNWNGWNEHVLKNTTVQLIEMQSRVERIPYTEEELAHMKNNWQTISPRFTEFGRVSLDQLHTDMNEKVRTTKVEFDLPIGDGETVPVVSVYEWTPLSLRYIDRYDKGKNKDILFSNKFTEFSFIFGHKDTQDVFIIQITSGNPKDWDKLNEYLGSN